MKKTLFLALVLLNFTTIYAQEKVKFSKKKFYVPSIAYSEFVVLDDVLTQSTSYQLDKNLSYQEHIFKKEFFDINGYIKEPQNGKLKIYVTIPLPKYIQVKKIDSIFNKDEKRWKYHFFSNFEVKIKVDVKCYDKILYQKEFINIEKSKLTEFYTKDDTRKAIELYDKTIRNAEIQEDYDILSSDVENAIYASMRRINGILNSKLGYSTIENKEKYEFLTSKNHTEYKQMLDFENEITSQLQKVTIEKGLDLKLLTPHLSYLESLLDKYEQNQENDDIRFIITNNLAQTYLLLENKEKSLFFTDLLIKNDKRTSRGSGLIDRIEKGNFVDKKIRSHTNRFGELKKLGFKKLEEKEEARLAFFEKVAQQEVDWEQEKIDRLAYKQEIKTKHNTILDSVSFQNNSDILDKVIKSMGGVEVLKNINKVHITSKLFFDDSNVSQSEEKWSTPDNYLLKKKRPDNYYEIINNVEAWFHDERDNSLDEKWKKLSNSGYRDAVNNLDLTNLLNSFQLHLWNNFELLEDEISDGKICYHLKYLQKTFDFSNRPIPKTEYDLFIDKTNYLIVSTEKTEFEDGKKNYLERKIYQDYREIITSNNAKVPHKILYEIEDFYGETFYQEKREKVEINPVFSNRIFIKEVYVGKFK